MAEHDRKIEEYKMFRGVSVGLKEKILYAVDEQYLLLIRCYERGTKFMVVMLERLMSYS